MIDILFIYKMWLLFSAPIVSFYLMGWATSTVTPEPIEYLEEFWFMLIPIVGHICMYICFIMLFGIYISGASVYLMDRVVSGFD